MSWNQAGFSSPTREPLTEHPLSPGAEPRENAGAPDSRRSSRRTAAVAGAAALLIASAATAAWRAGSAGPAGGPPPEGAGVVQLLEADCGWIPNDECFRTDPVACQCRATWRSGDGRQGYGPCGQFGERDPCVQTSTATTTTTTPARAAGGEPLAVGVPGEEAAPAARSSKAASLHKMFRDGFFVPVRSDDVDRARSAFEEAVQAEPVDDYPVGQPQSSPTSSATTTPATTSSSTPSPSVTYVIGGGYSTASGGSAETSCGASDLQEITTLEECQSAAEKLGIANIKIIQHKADNVPYGCTVPQGTATPESGAVGTNGHVYFNPTKGSNSGGDGGHVLMCKLATYAIGGGYTTASGGSAEASCGAVGLADITTLYRCQSAAEQVGIAHIEMVGPTMADQVPYGCTVQQGSATPASGAVGTNGRVHFSTTKGNNNGGDGGYVLLCRQPTYAIGGGYTIDSGGSAEASCGAVGLADITTLEVCQSAAEQVGIANIKTIQHRADNVPYGCTVPQGIATPESGAVGTTGHVYFNPTKGSNSGGDGGHVLICKPPVEPRSLTAPPAPPASGRKGSFLVLGDWGWDEGTHGNLGSAELQRKIGNKMHDKMKELGDVKFVINVGDSFYPSGVGSRSDPKWDSHWRNRYSKELRSVPWYSTYGNHDYQSDPCACGSSPKDCAQFNDNVSDTHWFYFPHWSWVKEHPELGLEVVSLDLNAYMDAWNHGVNPPHPDDCQYSSCPDACVAKLRARTDGAIKLFQSRLQASSAKNMLVFSHYPTDYLWPSEALMNGLKSSEGASGGPRHIEYFGGHRHNVDQDSCASIAPNNQWLVGGGGGWGTDGGNQGFVVGEISDDGTIKTYSVLL